MQATKAREVAARFRHFMAVEVNCLELGEAYRRIGEHFVELVDALVADAEKALEGVADDADKT